MNCKDLTSAIPALLGALALSVQGCSAPNAEPTGDDAEEISPASVTSDPATSRTSAPEQFDLQEADTTQLDSMLQPWRRQMAHSALPNAGCFEAAYPDRVWREVPCGTPPTVPIGRPPVVLVPEGRSVQPQSVGNGTGAMMRAGSLSYVEGAFTSVTGLSSESDGAANSFSLQINTNHFNTAACAGHAGCQGWQQFIFSNNGSTSGALFIQYWLLNYGSTCPSPYIHPTGNLVDCYRNSTNSTSIPKQIISSLPNLALTGYIGSPNDTANLWIPDLANPGHSIEYSVSSPNNVLNLSSSVWNQAEFNVYGNGDFKTATFAGTPTFNVYMSGGLTPAAFCEAGGTTGETNNLTLVPSSCCPRGGTNPGIDFVETLATGVTAPFCLLTEYGPVVSPLM